MLIAQISDTHIVLPSGHEEIETSNNRIENLRKCVKDIKSLTPAPDIIIHTGDVTHSGKKEEYEIVKSIFDDLDIPIFYTPGNRDNRINLKNVLNKKNVVFADNKHLIYGVEFIDFNIISMDTHCEDCSKGDLSEEKLDLLSKTLNEFKEKPFFIFMHHPPFNVSKTVNQAYEIHKKENVIEFSKLIKNYKKLFGVFSGHIHRNCYSKIGNVFACSMPSIAIDLSWESFPKKRLNKTQYLLHTYKESIGLKSEKRWA